MSKPRHRGFLSHLRPPPARGHYVQQVLRTLLAVVISASSFAQGGANAAESQWEVVRESDEMDDSAFVSVATLSEQPVKVFLAHAQAVLAIRCTTKLGEAPSLSVGLAVTKGTMEDDVVRVRFDDDPPDVTTWLIATTKKAYFAPNTDAVLARLRRAKTLRVEFKPFGADRVIARFRVDGLDTKLSALRDCLPQ